MRMILTGGITGGHIYPALAIGDKFREMIPDCEIIFIGSGDGLESDIVPKHGCVLDRSGSDRARVVILSSLSLEELFSVCRAVVLYSSCRSFRRNFRLAPFCTLVEDKSGHCWE